MDTGFFKSLRTRLSYVPLIPASQPDGCEAKSLSACSTPEARKLIEFETAAKIKVLPLGIIKMADQCLLTVAVPPLHAPDLEQTLKFAAGCRVKLLPVPESVLEDAIFCAYHGDERLLESKLQQVRAAEPKSPSFDRKPVLDFRPKQGETAQFLAALVDYGIAQGASDIHLLPTISGLRIRLRVDGNLLDHNEPICSPQLHSQIMTRIKVLAELDLTQKQLPQDGVFRVPVNNRWVNVRVSIMPTIHGEKAVLRLLGGGGPSSLSTLGFESRVLEFIEMFLQRNQGVALLAGPTGSGKTTTMYALLQKLRERNLSLVTIEDPVEIQLEGAAQTSINEKTGLSYATCLRSALRQDPDVILLGEIRDEESAKIAFQAALSGHLLLSTVHARNALEIFLRLESLGVDRFSLVQAVNLLICQHLLPRLCPTCKVIDLVHTNQLGLDVFQPVGCSRCDYSGFASRVLAAEALWLERSLAQALIRGDVVWHEMTGQLSPDYYMPLQLSLRNLLRRGDLSMHQLRSLL